MSTAAIQKTRINSLNYDPEPENRYRWVIGIGLAVVLILALVLAADQLMNPNRFPITEVEVSGELVNVSGSAVQAIVSSRLIGSFFSLNLAELEASVEKDPWVHTAAIRRVWPSTIVVEVVEVKPVAVWGKDKWLNFTGDLVSQPVGTARSQSAELPKISGPEAESRAVWRAFRHWSGQFASVGLSLDALDLDDTGLWSLNLTLGALALSRSSDSNLVGADQVTMVVERADAEIKVDRFILALSQELIDRFPEMQHVDLRYPNGFAIDWRDGLSSEKMLSASNGNDKSKTSTSN